VETAVTALPARSPRAPVRGMFSAVAALATGAALQAAPAAWAQEYELVPQVPDAQPPDLLAPWAASETGISLRAQIDVLYTPPGAAAPILVQKTFETRASAINLSSQYVFDTLNEAALAGVEQAIAGGAQTGRVSVVAVCYMFGSPAGGALQLAPMGVFINTTDLSMLPDGNAALHTKYKVIPPGR
jgi:hypothetical protein